MIQITKAEASYLRKKMPDAPIKRTTHKYYAEDNVVVRNILRKMPVKAVALTC